VVYDDAGNLTKMTSASGGGFSTSYQCFDNVGQVTAVYSGSGCSGTATASYAYDSLGDLTSETTGSSTTGFTYDQLGEMITNAAPAANVVGYMYDGDGLEAAMDAPMHGWSPPVTVDSSTAIEGISCPETVMCVAVDASGNVLTYNGKTFASARDIDGSYVLDSVSCPTTTFCAAVDDDGNVLTATNPTSTWSSASKDSTAITSVSCVSSSFCVAVDNAGGALKCSTACSTLSNWSKLATSPDSHELTSVSCATTTYCMAVDSVGDFATYNGSTWTSPASVGDSGRYLSSVSCPTTTFCATVDYDGHAVLDNSGTWASPVEIDGTKVMDAIICASSSQCAAVDDDGNETNYSPSFGWTVKNLDGTTPLNAVAYPNAYFYWVVDNSGHVITDDWADAAIQMTWDSTGPMPVIASDWSDRYIYGPEGEPVEEVTTWLPPANNPIFLTYVASNSSWVVTNMDGQLASYYRYDAFGNLALGTPDSAFGYAGQYTDTGPDPSGFDNMRARWYDPVIGGFTSLDPDFSATDQAYGYAGGDPVNGTDPSGLRGGRGSPNCPDTSNAPSCCKSEWAKNKALLTDPWVPEQRP
jgi:RHS repeat-associated protein